MSGVLKDRLSVCILIWQLSRVIFFAKRLLISYKNLNIVAVTQLKHLANSYPILKMENISQVLLFSKYCLTLFFMFAWSFFGRKFSKFGMQYIYISSYSIYSIGPWFIQLVKNERAMFFIFPLSSSSLPSFLIEYIYIF